jgi:hypothetical protein
MVPGFAGADCMGPAGGAPLRMGAAERMRPAGGAPLRMRAAAQHMMPAGAAPPYVGVSAAWPQHYQGQFH